MAGVGTEVGRIHIKVTPDTSGFRAQLNRELKSAVAGLDVEIPAELKNAGKVEAQLEALTKDRKTKVDVDVTGGKIKAVQDQVNRLARLETFTLDLNTRMAYLRAAQFKAWIAEEKVDVLLQARFDENQNTLRNRLRAAIGLKPIKVPIEADQEVFSRSVAKLKTPKVPNFDKFIPNFGTGLNPAGYAVVIAGILAVAAPLVGLLTSALLTLPGLISAVAVPIAAITLGLDGFKKAAESIKEPFDALRASISEKVTSQFTPIFEQLTQGFPILERSIPRVTQGLADIAKSVTTFITEGTGATQLEQLIGGIGERLSQVAPGIRDFTAAILGLANQFVNGGALEGVGQWFNDTMADFKNWVAEISASGQLDAAFSGLGASLKVVADALGKIALEGLDFITDPGKVQAFTEALAGLGDVLKNIVGISESLAPAFKLLDLALKVPSVAGVLVDMGNRGRDIGAALGDGVTSGLNAGFKLGTDQLVPPDIGAAVSEQIKNQITVSAEDQKQALRSAFTAGGVDTAVAQQLTQQVQAAIEGARNAMTEFGPELQAAVDQSLLSLATIGDKIGAAFTAIGPAVAAGFQPAVFAAQSGVNQIISAISSGFGNLFNTVVGAFSGLAGAVSTGMASGSQAAAAGVTNILQVISAGLAALPAVVQQWFSSVAPAAQAGMAPAIATVGAMCQQIIATMLSFTGAAQQAGTAIGASFAQGISSAGGLVSSAAEGLVGLARAFFPSSPAEKGPFSGQGWVTYSGEAVGEAFADGISSSSTEVINTVKALMQAVKDVFGSAEGLALNFNFGAGSLGGGTGFGAGGSTMLGGLTTSLGDMAGNAQNYQSAVLGAIEPSKQLTADDKERIKALSQQIDLLEIRRKELEGMLFWDKNNEAIKGELELIRQQKNALGLERDKLQYAQKYGNTVSDTTQKYADYVNTAAQLPLDFARATANQAMTDLGMSGGGVLGAALDWGSQFAQNAIGAGSKYIFNVSNIDEAKTMWQNTVNVESRGTVGR